MPPRTRVRTDYAAHEGSNSAETSNNVLPALGTAGLSFSLATGAPAAVGGVNPDPATSALVAEQVMDEEQISDVSLTTFHVLDDEGGSTRRLRTQPTVVSQGACGADLYLPQIRRRSAGPFIGHRHRPGLGRPVRRANTDARLAHDTDRSVQNSGCHRRHEGKIVRQFEQVGNCGGESNIT